MSALTDLIEQVNDQGLRERLLEEASRLEKQKKWLREKKVISMKSSRLLK